MFFVAHDLTVDGNHISCRVDFLAAVEADGTIHSHMAAFAQFLQFPPRPPARMAQELIEAHSLCHNTSLERRHLVPLADTPSGLPDAACSS